MILSLLGLLCIVIGFIAAIIDERIIFGPLTWFVAAIAFNTIGDTAIPFIGRRGARR